MRDNDEWYPPRIPKGLSPLDAAAIVMAILFSFFWGYIFGLAGK